MFKWFGELGQWLVERFTSKQAKKLPRVTYQHVVETERPPPISAVMAHTVYVVRRQAAPRWTMFHCPCGCGDVITLSLQETHDPRWSLEFTDSGRTSFHPSVWKTTGCRSHFWIKDGRVLWV